MNQGEHGVVVLITLWHWSVDHETWSFSPRLDIDTSWIFTWCTTQDAWIRLIWLQSNIFCDYKHILRSRYDDVSGRALKFLWELWEISGDYGRLREITGKIPGVFSIWWGEFRKTKGVSGRYYTDYSYEMDFWIRGVENVSLHEWCLRMSIGFLRNTILIINQILSKISEFELLFDSHPNQRPITYIPWCGTMICPLISHSNIIM